MNVFFFWIFSILMIVCGLAVVLGRNPVASALSFAFAIFAMSGLFVMLHAFFLAAVQVLVTAGAVMVLFLFIIMLLDITAFEKAPRQKLWLGASLILALSFVFLVAKTLNTMPEGSIGFINEDSLAASQVVRDQIVTNPDGSTTTAAPTQAQSDKTDDTHQIGKLLFTKYVAPFEVTSLLLLIATIGVIVLCKEDILRRTPGEEINREAPPTDAKKETSLTR